MGMGRTLPYFFNHDFFGDVPVTFLFNIEVDDSGTLLATFSTRNANVILYI